MATKGRNFHSLHALREPGAEARWTPPAPRWQPPQPRWQAPGRPAWSGDGLLTTAGGSATGSPARIRYRPGIDGLRALAVAAVLLYHADARWAPGGFLGVDLFFVISGFLITTLLIAEVQRTGRVSLESFYRRRARRLLPALGLVLASTVAVMALLAPRDLAAAGGDLLASVGYVANWWFIGHHESYFQSIGRPSPVQHLWSLAVEEQFYLVWPFIVAMILAAGHPPAARRRGRGRARRRGRLDGLDGGAGRGPRRALRHGRLAGLPRHRHPCHGRPPGRGRRGSPGADPRGAAGSLRRGRGPGGPSRAGRSLLGLLRGQRVHTGALPGRVPAVRRPLGGGGGGRRAGGGLAGRGPGGAAAAVAGHPLLWGLPLALADLRADPPAAGRALDAGRRPRAAGGADAGGRGGELPPRGAAHPAEGPAGVAGGPVIRADGAGAAPSGPPSVRGVVAGVPRWRPHGRRPGSACSRSRPSPPPASC